MESQASVVKSLVKDWEPLARTEIIDREDQISDDSIIFDGWEFSSMLVSSLSNAYVCKSEKNIVS